MSIRIEDGRGNGYLAGITRNNKVRTYTTVETEASFESEANGLCFSWSASYDYTAGDTVLLVKNTDTSKDLLIEDISIDCDTNTEVLIHFPEDVETPTGTAVVGTNLNRQSGKAAQAVAKEDETTNSQGPIFGRFFVQANSNSLFLPIRGIVVLGLNDSIAVDYVTEGGACYVNIVGYYHTVNE
jgi:hypothetical protein